MRYSVTAALAMVLTMQLAAQAPAQPSGEGLRFEVASVKPSKNEPGGGPPAGGALVVRGATLEDLITRLYGIKPFQLDGGPSWIRSDRFDISARAASGSATEAQMFEMLRQLLVDRFGLRVRFETRQAPVYKLRMARADGRFGAGLNRTSADCEKAVAARAKGAAQAQGASREIDPLKPICGISFMSPVAGTAGLRSTMGGMPLAQLVQLITNTVGAPVIDETGLTGLFDIVVEYERFGRPPIGQTGASEPTADLPPPPLQSALEQQLGLKLERQMGPMQILVIEAVQQPMPD